jgi:ribosomal RNA-processing protein 36
MPRRPRPVNRKAPLHAGNPSKDFQIPKSQPRSLGQPQPQVVAEESFGEDDDVEEGASGSESVLEQEEDSEADADADAPRVAQWLDEEELDLSEHLQEDSEDDREAEGSFRPVNVVSNVNSHAHD